jgi:hypothetical protein
MKTALELTAPELQGLELSESDIARAVALAVPANARVKALADERLRFEDEPSGYAALLRDAADPK